MSILELLEGLNDYENPNNRNRVVYHDQSTPQNEKIQKVINDAVSLLPKCKDEYGQTDDYQLLQRAIEETSKLAADKNIDLLTTGFLGRKPKEIHKGVNLPVIMMHH